MSKHEFPKENQIWQMRSKHGRDKFFESPEILWDKAVEYFKWCDDNPFYEDQLFAHKGDVTHEPAEKKRPYTLQGLCIFIGCGTAYFRNFKSENRKNKEVFLEVIKQIEEIIFEQQFSGASAGFFKENIIARSLGLKDGSDITSNGQNINPVITSMVDGKVVNLKVKKKKDE